MCTYTSCMLYCFGCTVLNVCCVVLCAVQCSTCVVCVGHRPSSVCGGVANMYYSQAASPLWSLVASSSADGSVRVWSTICWSCLAVLTEQPRDIPSPAKGASRLGTSKQGPFALLCVALNQECIVAGSTDGTILMWSAEAICARVQGESSKAAAAQGDGCAMLEQAMSSDDSSLTQNVTQNADTEGEAGVGDAGIDCMRVAAPALMGPCEMG